MKKWEKNLYLTIGIIFLFICITAIALYVFQGQIENNIFEIVRIIILLGCSLIMILVFFSFIIIVIMTIKNGLHNIKKCDDDLFENIDRFKHCWGESNENYIKQIQIINLYYKTNGKVDELIKNNQLERLFKRKDFLLKQRYLFDDVSTYFNSLVISVIASFLFQMFSLTNPIFLLIGMITILVAFFLIIF